MGVSDAIICKAIYSTLEGQAAELFKSLEPRSIDCFSELARRFIQRFATSKAAWRHFTYLEVAKQKEGETLTDFLTKWKNSIGEVEPMDDRMTINVLHWSLRVGCYIKISSLDPCWRMRKCLVELPTTQTLGKQTLQNDAKRQVQPGTIGGTIIGSKGEERDRRNGDQRSEC